MLKKSNTNIKLSSTTSKPLNLYLINLTSLLNQHSIQFSFVRLPTVRKRLTTFKSPHVHKKAKKHFEVEKHSVLVIIKSSYNSNFLLKSIFVNLPKSISVKITK